MSFTANTHPNEIFTKTHLTSNSVSK